MIRRVSACILLTCALSACGNDARFVSRNAAEFAPQDRMTVTVVGIYKDGIMSADAWEALGPKLSKGLHGDACVAAYSLDHIGKDPNVAQAIDDYARDNGITDELLGELAPAAEGDLLVAFTVAGRAPKSPNPGASFIRTSPAPTPMRGGMMNRPPRTSRDGRRRSTNAYEVAVTFYSPKLRRSVALLSMVYTGASEDEALDLFAKKLDELAPHTTCAGVKAAPLDAEKIRALTAANPPEN